MAIDYKKYAASIDEMAQAVRLDIDMPMREKTKLIKSLGDARELMVLEVVRRTEEKIKERTKSR